MTTLLDIHVDTAEPCVMPKIRYFISWDSKKKQFKCLDVFADGDVYHKGYGHTQLSAWESCVQSRQSLLEVT